MPKQLPQRSEVPVEYTWDAASIFPTDQEWEAEMARVPEAIRAVSQYAGRLGESGAVLADWLDSKSELEARLGKLHVYAVLRHTVDTADTQGTAMFSRVNGLWAQADAAMAFGEPEILALKAQRLRALVAEEPRLAVYSHYFDTLEQRRPHIRSAEVEELLGQVREPFSYTRRIHGTLSDADLTFRPARDSQGAELEVAQGAITSLLASPDRETRRTAWESYADAYLSMRNTIAECLAAGVHQHVVVARARRYGSALEAALAASHIPESVFHNLLATYRKNLPTWHKYWDIRRRALGYGRLHVFDIKAPLARQTPQVPFRQSVEWVCEGMAPLGKEYVETLRRGVLEQRWVDVYPNKGKRMGAFSNGVQGTHPFILMSYNDDLFGMSTLAHELGHSLHSYFAWKTQPPVYSDYSIFVAEVASNFNQAMVRAHLLETHSDKEFQIAVIEEAMSNFHRYFFVMPTLALFEQEIHARAERGEALTADRLMELMTELFREGYGNGVEVDADRVGITWAQFPTHLYSNFYVYQYATGISGAHALAERVRREGAPAAKQYLEFLKAGGSLYPLDALRLAGVDLSRPEPVERTFALFAGMVDRLGELLEE